MTEIEIWHPVRQCPSCGLTTDDEDSQKCEMCLLPWKILYQWDVVTGTPIDSKWFLLKNAIFLDSQFTFPRRILMLHSDGSISHVGVLESKHILKEDEYWTRKLPQVATIDVEIQDHAKWKKIETETSTTEETKHLFLLICPVCGEQLSTTGLPSHLSENTHMKEIQPGIFLGAQWNAFCETELKYNNIQALLNCAVEINSRINQVKFGPHYRKLEWDDTMEQVITKDILDIIPWIESHVDNHRPLLIHCAQGRSRSVAVAVAILMQTTNITYEDALRKVQIHKPFASPNQNFKNQVCSLFPKKR